MNRFLLIPKLKPEFKMAQRLPLLFGIPKVGDHSARAPVTAAFCLKETVSLTPPASPKAKSFAATDRNLAS